MISACAVGSRSVRVRFPATARSSAPLTMQTPIGTSSRWPASTAAARARRIHASSCSECDATISAFLKQPKGNYRDGSEGCQASDFDAFVTMYCDYFWLQATDIIGLVTRCACYYCALKRGA